MGAGMTPSPATKARLLEAVIARTGHAYYSDKERLLLSRVRERMQVRVVKTLEAYLDLLDDKETGETEWRALESLLTIGETYFFRHADHIEALRKKILPALIEKNRATQSMRIWSIGCANGAETYSIAILLRELLGDETGQWRISLTGGDISDLAIAAARNAVYGAWALRTVTPQQRTEYFEQVDARHWRLKPAYRAMARFERQNLLDLLSGAAPLQWNEFDLILCRNVLIYFSAEVALKLIDELRARMAAGGTLLIGHAEATLSAQSEQFGPEPLPSEFEQTLDPVAPLQPFAFVETPLPPPLPLPPAPAVSTPKLAPVEAIDDMRAAADAGEYQKAHALCVQLLAADPVSPALHYYDALLSQISDDLVRAEASLRRALYLDRRFLLAHHRLGLLLLASNRATEARRALLTAKRLAEDLPADHQLADAQGATAGELAAALTRQLDRMDAAA